VYQFAVADFCAGAEERVEGREIAAAAVRNKPGWHNQVVRGYSLSLGLFADVPGNLGRGRGTLFLGQAVFAVFVSK